MSERDDYEDLDLPPPIQWVKFAPLLTMFAVFAIVVGLGFATILWAAVLAS